MDPPLNAMTPRLRRALADAAHQASRAGHRHIGTEHVLLALAIDGDGIAGQVLTHLGVREAVQDRLSEVLPTLGGDAGGVDLVGDPGTTQDPSPGKP